MNYFGLPHNARQLTYLRDLLRELTVRDMKLRYKRSILGIAWCLLNPLTQLLVFLFIFTAVFESTSHISPRFCSPPSSPGTGFPGR